MKGTIKISLLLTICFLVLGIINSFAQETKTDTFKVYGNCEMCKSNIEGTLKKKDGIVKKSWSPQSKMLTVTYDPAKITSRGIKEKIAAAGYDTDEIKG